MHSEDPEAMIGKKHFVIKFDLQELCYQLCDLGEGSGTFVRFDKPLVRVKMWNFLIGTSSWAYTSFWRISYGCAI